MSLRSILFAVCIVCLPLSGVIAAACDPSDGNNTEGDATPIGFTDTGSGIVCPDDPFDFYVIEIPDGSALSGEVTFSSPQEWTVIRIYNSETGDRIVDDVFTNETTKEFVFTINPGSIPSGTYYIRLFFWSVAAYDHEYTLMIDLSDGSSTPLIKINPDVAKMILSNSPWPNPMGTARNANRSYFQGPFGLLCKTHSAKMGKTYTDYMKPMAYQGLVVGSESEIFFVDNDTSDIIRYKFGARSSSPIFSSAGTRPPCFGNRGKLYTVEFGAYWGAILVCYNKFPGDEAWRRGIPVGTDYAVMCAGEQIYTRVGGSTHKLQVWDKEGNQVCELPFTSPIGGVAEALAGKKFFVQTRKNLYQFNFDGTQQWVYEGFSGHMFSSNQDPWEALGPIVTWNGYVWAASPLIGPWVVLNPDGTEYKSGGSSDFLNPRPMGGEGRITVALGSDNRFYVASDGFAVDTVTCYEDWDQEVWTVQVEGGKIHDMILDSMNRIYVCFSDWFSTGAHGYGWKCLDPANGNVLLAYMDIGEPVELEESRIGAELAIGSDRQLVMLLKAGYIAVFETEKLELEIIDIGDAMKMKKIP